MTNPFTIMTISTPPAVVLNPQHPRFEKEKRPKKLRLQGEEYTRKETVATASKQRERSSTVWQFGEALIAAKDGREVFYCYDCEREGKRQKLPSARGTTNARNHLYDAHRRNRETGIVEEPTAAKGTKSSFITLVDKGDFETFQDKLLRWFVCCQLALLMLENAFFRDLVNYLNAAVGRLMPKARSTLRNWIYDAFTKEKEKLKASLATRRSMVHLSFDIWSASNWFGVICICGYWLDCEGNRQRRLLSFRRIYGSHSGENQAEVILEVLREYGVREVGYFVCDNALSNDVAVKLVLRQLYPGIEDPKITTRRLRCFGHIVNLCAQSLLSASDVEAKKATEELEFDEEADVFVRTTRIWLSQGPLGKLHRVVKYVLASTKRREEFAGTKGPRRWKKFDDLSVSVALYREWYCDWLQLKARF